MLRRTFVAALLFAILAPAYARAQAAIDDKFFDAKGVKLRYVDVGRGDAVVLVHGFSSNLDENWSATGVISALANDFRVVALDCRGHGKSDKPHDPSAYGNEMSEDIARLMDHLGIRRAHVVGYSMGGAIVGKFVTTHPDRVITATFGASAPRVGWTAQQEQANEELATSLEQGHGLRPLILRLLPPNEPKPSDEVIEQRSKAIVGRNDPLALAAVQRASKGQVVTAGEVRALKMPLLAIVGGDDPVKAAAEAFKAMKPEVNIVVIDGATHSGTRAAPGRAEFHSALHDFLVAHRLAPTM